MNTKKNKLTIKQKETLEAIIYFIDKFGYSPTYREIANLLECDVSTVFYKVLQLENKGYIKNEPGLIRTIQVIKKLND